MPKQTAVDILLEASRRRKALVGSPPDLVVQAQLGHLIDYQIEEQPWRGLAPGRLKWQATYQVETILLARPGSGSKTVTLKCRTCGGMVSILIRSRRAIGVYSLVMVSGVALAAIAAAFCVGYEHAVYGALIAFYLLAWKEILGEIDHHSMVRITQESQPGHKLLEWRLGLAGNLSKQANPDFR